MYKSIPLVLIFGLVLSACSDPEPQGDSPVAEEETVTLDGSPVAESARPAFSEAESCLSEGEIDYLCGLVNVEDMLQIGDSPWIIASGMNGDLSGLGNNGALHLINSDTRQGFRFFPGEMPSLEPDMSRFSACPGPLDTGNFSGHGLALREQAGSAETYDLYMTSHGAREAIEVFRLDNSGATPAITWVGCVPIPGTAWTNSVTILEDGGFYATQFMDNALHGIDNVTAGEMTGHVFEWHPDEEVTIIPGTELAGANGILVSEDEQTLFVAAFGGHRIVRFDLSVSPVTAEEVHIDLMPDNLRWTPEGMILTGGGEWYEGCPGTECGGSVVYEINPDTLEARAVAGPYTFTDLAHASVALQLGNEYWIGSYMGNRVAVVPAD